MERKNTATMSGLDSYGPGGVGMPGFDPPVSDRANAEPKRRFASGSQPATFSRDRPPSGPFMAAAGMRARVGDAYMQSLQQASVREANQLMAATLTNDGLNEQVGLAAQRVKAQGVLLNPGLRAAIDSALTSGNAGASSLSQVLADALAAFPVLSGSRQQRMQQVLAALIAEHGGEHAVSGQAADQRLTTAISRLLLHAASAAQADGLGSLSHGRWAQLEGASMALLESTLAAELASTLYGVDDVSPQEGRALFRRAAEQFLDDGLQTVSGATGAGLTGGNATADDALWESLWRVFTQVFKAHGLHRSPQLQAFAAALGWQWPHCAGLFGSDPEPFPSPDEFHLFPLVAPFIPVPPDADYATDGRKHRASSELPDDVKKAIVSNAKTTILELASKAVLEITDRQLAIAQLSARSRKRLMAVAALAALEKLCEASLRAAYGLLPELDYTTYSPYVMACLSLVVRELLAELGAGVLVPKHNWPTWLMHPEQAREDWPQHARLLNTLTGD